MFEHSVKVPRNFKIAASIVKKVITEGGGVKNLLYDNKLRHFRTNVIYALVTETIKHDAEINKLFETTGLLEKEPRLDQWLAKVITTELLFGKKELPGGSKPEKTILSYREQFENIPRQPQVEVKPEVRRPRYVRINTNLLTTSDAISAFQDEGFRFIRCTSGPYDDYLSQIKTLTEYDFTQDYHVKTMFVFHPSTKFHDYDLYLENKIILQDKATALPVQLLAPPQGSVIMDMCAAPGNKTTQLAAFIRNQGKIYAVERNEERYKTLCDFVERTESKCVTTMHRDTLDIKRGECDDVEYIVLDPSCSGSGMQLSVHSYVDDVRLARLTSLQEKFLKHAMNSFPNAKKIVYSTCSLFPQENERVISNVVKQSRAKWKVLNVKEMLKDQWNNFGSGMYGEIGTRCLYSRPDSDLTTGFFLAVLERDSKQQESQELKRKEQTEKNSLLSQNKIEPLNDTEISNHCKQNSKTKGKKRKKMTTDVCTDTIQEESEVCQNVIKVKKKKAILEDIQESNSMAETIECSGISVESGGDTQKRKTKKKKKRVQDGEMVSDQDVIIAEEVIENSNEKKQTKLEKVDDIVILETESEPNLNKKKKKKNKSSKAESENVGHNSDHITRQDGGNLIDDTVINCEIERKSSSKKKGNKSKDFLKENDSSGMEVLIESADVNNQIDYDKTNETIHSKKKKKKSKELTNNVELILHDDSQNLNAVDFEKDEQSSNKKKRKSKDSEIIEDFVVDCH
ncbi:unnamed protein product, partial [Leptidea sinapis]